MTTGSISREDLLGSVATAVRLHRMTVEEFIALGLRDELEDDELRDLWLMVGAELKT